MEFPQDRLYENKINDSFLFVWIDKAKNDILNSIDDITLYKK